MGCNINKHLTLAAQNIGRYKQRISHRTNTMAFEIARAGWLQRQSTVLKKWKRSWCVLYVDGYLKYFETPESHTAEDAARMQTDCLKIICGLDLANVNPPPTSSRNCLFQLKFRDKEWNFCADSMDDMRAWQDALEQSRVVSGLPQRPQGYSAEAPPPYSPAGAAPAYPQQQQGVPPPPVYHHQQAGVPPTYPQPAPGQHTTTYINPQQGSTTTVVRNSAYPVQGAAVAYPGQNYYGSNPPNYIVQPNPNQPQVIYVNGQPQHRNRDGDMAMGFIAGAAMGSMMYGPMWW